MPGDDYCTTCDAYRDRTDIYRHDEHGRGDLCDGCCMYCDVCDEPMEPARSFVAYGIETTACDKCRGIK